MAKLLIVDSNRKMWKRLRTQKHRVERVTNVSHALKLLALDEFDLVLSDRGITEANGFEFLRELRKRSAFVDVPVIVVTAKELTAEDVRILSGQTERIIAKDQTYLTELAAAVRGRLPRQPARATESVPHDGLSSSPTSEKPCTKNQTCRRPPIPVYRF